MEKIKACIDLCIIDTSNLVNVDDDDAAKLLIGVDDRSEVWNRKIEGVMTLPSDGIVSVSSLEQLMKMNDNNIRVYRTGRIVFKSTLKSPADLLSSTPLEAAYFWALACRSAVDGYLVF